MVGLTVAGNGMGMSAGERLGGWLGGLEWVDGQMAVSGQGVTWVRREAVIRLPGMGWLGRTGDDDGGMGVLNYAATFGLTCRRTLNASTPLQRRRSIIQDSIVDGGRNIYDMR